MKKHISKFQYLTQDHPVLSHAQLADLACSGGADWVQLRLKGRSEQELLKLALETKTVCRKHEARLIINDHVRLAAEIGADGVHLGKADMGVSEARILLGSSAIIGATANTEADVEQILQTSADYVGLGPFRFTLTKEKLSPVIGLEGIEAIARKYASLMPIIAIGGIRPEDAEAIFRSGIHGFAVSSAVNLSHDPIAAASKFLFAVYQYSTQKTTT